MATASLAIAIVNGHVPVAKGDPGIGLRLPVVLSIRKAATLFVSPVWVTYRKVPEESIAR
jgi:hypothetical protein